MRAAPDGHSAVMSHLQALADAIGPRNVLRDPPDVAPYAVDWRGTFRGAPVAVLRPGTVEEVSAAVRACAAEGIAVVPAGGRTGLCGGAVVPENGPPAAVLSLRAVEPHPRRGRARLLPRRRGRLRGAAGAGSRRRGGPVVPALLGRAGLGAGRRRAFHQRRRHPHPPLGQRPRPGARAGGGAARRPGAERPPPRPQGQQRLRAPPPLPRRRGHARHHHRRRAQARAAAQARGNRLRRRALAGRRALAAVPRCSAAAPR